MNFGPRTKSFYFFCLFIVLIAIDQLSKYLIRHFGGFYVCNPNISWGISVPRYFFWILWLAITAFMSFLLFRKKIIHNSYFILFILAGAIANIIDRFRFGCVIDFIDLQFWPVFNLADVFIVSGAVYLLVRWKKL
jgi:signal peptidase II